MDDRPHGTATENHVENPGFISTLLQAGAIYGGIHLYMGEPGAEAQRVPPEYQEYLRRAFVPAEPEKFADFRSRFRGEAGRRTVFLLGEPGSGRTVAAVALLASAGLRVHRLVLDPEGREGRRLKGIRIDAGDGYLIDLSGHGTADLGLLHDVLEFGARARSAGAGTAVVLGPGRHGAELPPGSDFTVVRPPAMDVFAAHFRLLVGGERLSAWLANGEVRGAMAEALPADAVRLARMALETSGAEAGQEKWIDAALHAFRNWRQELEDWFGNKQGEDGAWPRVLLIAGALLSGRDAVEVLVSADRLAGMLGLPPGDAGGLVGPGVDEALKSIGAVRDGSGRLRFQKVEYDSAVLDYVWQEHPRLRDRLVEWSIRSIAESSDGHGREAAERWADLLMRNGDDETANNLFNALSRTTQTSAAATRFGALVASAPDFGKRIRRRVYDIAQRRPTIQQSTVAARVCAEYGKVIPSSALLRLRWLAASEAEAVRRSVIDALEELARSGMREEVIDELEDWTESESGSRASLACETLAAMLSRAEDGTPALLMETCAASDEAEGWRLGQETVRAWKVLFDQACKASLAKAADVWLPRYLRRDDVGNVAATIMVSAVAGAPDGSEESMNRRIVTANRMVYQWCDEAGQDDHDMDVVSLQRWIHGAAHQVFGDPESERPG